MVKMSNRLNLLNFIKIFWNNPILVVSVLLLNFVNAMAQTITPERFITDMVERHQFDKSYLEYLLNQAKVRKSIIKAMTPHPTGKAKPWYQYRRIFIQDQRISEGVTFWHNHASILKRAEATYGVPPQIIIAIIGVETLYGQNQGNFRVIDALVTLSFHYSRRADFFREELEHYLLLTREEGFDPLQLQGSYAGAMGIGQFMPSSFRRYAVDFDGDGQRDIWNNYADAIGSVANYFHRFGWQPGQPIVKATQINPTALDTLLGLAFKPEYTLTQLQQVGLKYHGDEPANTLGLFIDLETEQGPAYWLGFQNYYVITRYNHSKHYAMAVYQLAQEIAHQYAQENSLLESN
jgi:membrane-bound lytic murein transglycosylase B